jgi:arsenite methyltransferase
MTKTNRTADGLTNMEGEVRRRYREAALRTGSSCCTPGPAACCGSTSTAGCCPAGSEFFGRANYSPDETAGLPENISQASLGCGNPIGLATIKPGEIVVDLGSGAGLDALLAADKTGPAGKVYGIDMTPEMIDVARANTTKAGIGNIEFILGHIDALPLPEQIADVIISNCVINLAEDKDPVLREALRVLKPGGRLAVSDMTFLDSPPEAVRRDATLWASCVGGALTVDEFHTKLTAAGFVDITITTGDYLEVAGSRVAKADIRAYRPT